jgi:ATP-dependent helicase HrpB
VHPRLARLVVEGEARGCRAAACVAAALISERDVRAGTRASFASGPRASGADDRGAEIVDLVDLFREAEAERFRPDVLRRLELDRRATEEVDKVHRQLAGAGDRGAARAGARGGPLDADTSRALRHAILAAFPDRVARRREAKSRTVVLAAGGAAELGFEPSADWLVTVDVEERDARHGGLRGPRGSATVVRLGSVIEPEWLLDLFPDRIADVDRRAFNPDTQRVEQKTGLAYGALMLDETVAPAPADDESARLLADALLARGVDRLPGGDAIKQLLARIDFARQAVPEAPLPALAAGDVAGLVRAACAGRVAAAELDDPAAIVLATLPHDARRALDTAAPDRITLSGGRTVAVHYDPTSPPWVESRLQDFFGTRTVPAIGAGRVPLTVHLLAPNGRAVQVTRDLASFWTQHYPALRRELGRRYPKHAWPEDGATARPPPPPPPRRPR